MEEKRPFLNFFLETWKHGGRVSRIKTKQTNKKTLQLKRVPNNTNKNFHPEGVIQSGQISPVFKDSAEPGWESGSHMVKPHPHKTKDILKSVPAHCPPPKNVNCSAPEPYGGISRGLTSPLTSLMTLKRYQWKGRGGGLQMSPAWRCVMRDTVDRAATDFTAAFPN